MAPRLIALAEATDSEISRWRELAAEAIEPNPFFEPEFLTAAASVFDAGQIGLLVLERQGSWDALIPVSWVHSWHRIPLPGTIAWDHIYSFLGTPLVRRDDPARHIGELVEAAAAGRGFYFGLDQVGSDGPVFAGIERRAEAGALTMTPLRVSERAALRRRPDGEYLQIKAKHRREWRRQRNRLSERLGAPLEVSDDHSRDAAVDDFLVLEASGWKGRAGTAFAQREGHAAFFTEICPASPSSAASSCSPFGPATVPWR